MSKPFDATLKNLVQNHPEDWLAQAGLPFEGQIDVIDADLSTVTTAADKIIRVHAPNPCLLHVELQADEDEFLDNRVLKYNVLQFVQHKLPVHSLVVLLRSAADDPKLTGTLRCPSPIGGDTLVFHYQVIRVWLEPPGTFLNGGLGPAAAGNRQQRHQRRITGHHPADERPATAGSRLGRSQNNLDFRLYPCRIALLFKYSSTTVSRSDKYESVIYIPSDLERGT